MSKMTKTERVAEAIAHWESAKEDPLANWRGIANMLRACLPDAKPKAEGRPAIAAVYAPWHDNERPHKLRRGNGKRVVVVQFVDGRQTKASHSDEGKFNIGRAVRVACTMYRHQARKAALAYGPAPEEFWHKSGWFEDSNEWYCMRPGDADCYVEHIPVPEIATVRCETYGDEFDPWIANRETKEYRAAGETPAERKARADKGRETYAAAVAESARMRGEMVPVADDGEPDDDEPEAEPEPDLFDDEPVDSEPTGVDSEPSPVDSEPLPATEPEAPKVGAVLLAWQGEHEREAQAFLALARGQRQAMAALATQRAVIAPVPVEAPVRPPVAFQRRMGARALRMAATAGTLPAWGTVVVQFPVNVGV